MSGDPIAVVCPRCGYDLRGQLAIARAQLVGPLHPNPLPEGEGVCSECGLTFQWRDVTDPLRSGPSWCFEYEPSRRRLPLAAVKTWLRMLWPWGFWSRLQMHHEPRWRRIGLMYLFALIPFIVLYVVFQTSVAVYVRRTILDDYQGRARQAPQMIARLQAMKTHPSLLALPANEQANFITSYNSQIAFLQAQVAQAPTIEMSYLAAIGEAVIAPFEGSSSGRISWLGFAQPYPSPRALPAPLPANVPDFWSRVLLATIYLIPLIFACLFMPVSLGLLPVSRRRAKVRWRHIWRITAYSGLLLVALIIIAAIFGALWALAPGISRTLRGFSELWLVIVPAAVLVGWWGCAIKRYLRIQHAWAVAILLTVLCGLAALITGGTIVGMLT
jgi:hypothetical protein